MAFDTVDVIRVKRDGGELSDAQIDWVIDAYTRGVVADEQMSALAMAIFLNGMNRREIARWTTAMIDSGERMDFSGLGKPTADKHSTGGVGDKITLPLAPLVARGVHDVASQYLAVEGTGVEVDTSGVDSGPHPQAHRPSSHSAVEIVDIPCRQGPQHIRIQSIGAA
mgnify:CR=1 FL=1